jgi:hypothetical protein
MLSQSHDDLGRCLRAAENFVLDELVIVLDEHLIGLAWQVPLDGLTDLLPTGCHVTADHDVWVLSKSDQQLVWDIDPPRQLHACPAMRAPGEQVKHLSRQASYEVPADDFPLDSLDSRGGEGKEEFVRGGRVSGQRNENRIRIRHDR